MSNTKDTYVPALSRHVFTEGGCSNGPMINPVSTNRQEHLRKRGTGTFMCLKPWKT